MVLVPCEPLISARSVPVKPARLNVKLPVDAEASTSFSALRLSDTPLELRAMLKVSPSLGVPLMVKLIPEKVKVAPLVYGTVPEA